MKKFVFLLLAASLLLTGNIQAQADEARPQPSDEALLKSYEIAANQGDMEAATNIARSLSLKEEDIERAIPWYEKSANLGDSSSMQELGIIYSTNQYSSNYKHIKNEQKAYDWFKKAGEKGEGFSQFRLAQIYQNGIGIAKNEALAETWFAKALQLGYENNFSGDRPKELPNQYLNAIEASAHQGSIDAMLFLAGHYPSVASDYPVAKGQAPRSGQVKASDSVKWYEKAVQAGSTQAMLSLGLLYKTGMGDVKKDESKAFYWLHKAATKGKGIAQDILSEMYAAGINGKIDLEQSSYWKSKADEQPFKTAGL